MNVSGSGGLVQSEVNETLGNSMMLVLRVGESEDSRKNLLLRGIVRRKVDSPEGTCFGLQWTEATCDNDPSAIKILLETLLEGATGRITIQRERESTSRPLFTFEFADRTVIAAHALKGSVSASAPDSNAALPHVSSEAQASHSVDMKRGGVEPVPGGSRDALSPPPTVYAQIARNRPGTYSLKESPRAPHATEGHALHSKELTASGMHRGKEIEFQLLHLDKEVARLSDSTQILKEGDRFAMKLTHPSARRPIRINAEVTGILNRPGGREYEVRFERPSHRGVAMDIESFFQHLNRS